MSGLPDALVAPFSRLGQAAGAAIVRELSDRLDAIEEAVRENTPLDRAVERQVALLEQALVPLLETAVAAGPVAPFPHTGPERTTTL